MKVSIIIPIYYCDPSLFITIETCLSTLSVTYPWFEVVLVDDCSPLEIPPHWDITYTNPVNLGYTRTVNRGLMEATGDVLIVANDDLQFYPGCLDRFLELPDNVIASPADTASGSLDGFGAIFGMSRNTFNLMGLLDEQYRHFYSDQEYQERAEKLGVEVVKWKDIVIPHPESSTFKVLGNKDQLLDQDRVIYEEEKKRNTE